MTVFIPPRWFGVPKIRARERRRATGASRWDEGIAQGSKDPRLSKRMKKLLRENVQPKGRRFSVGVSPVISVTGRRQFRTSGRKKKQKGRGMSTLQSSVLNLPTQPYVLDRTRSQVAKQLPRLGPNFFWDSTSSHMCWRGGGVVGFWSQTRTRIVPEREHQSKLCKYVGN